MIRTLIVDDEFHARSMLKQLLAASPDVEIVDEAVDGEDALQKIRQLSPMLVFLDVQMPGLTGVELVEVMKGESIPYFVFTTAYSDYAPSAFDLDAVDYLLKPFDQARLSRALERVRQHLRADKSAAAGLGWAGVQRELERLTRVVDGSETLQSLTVHVGNKLRFLNPNSIRYIAAQGNYVRIVGDGEPILVRERLVDLEELLQGNRFLRIHRSILVNLTWVRELRSHEQGGYELLLDGGESLICSVGYRERVKNSLDLERRRKRR